MKVIGRILLATVLSYPDVTSVVAAEGTGAGDLHALEATVGQLLEQDHYTQRRLDSYMAAQILETYLKSLDYDKLFFAQDDIDQIRNEYSSGLGDDILLGNLTSAKNIYEIFKQRVDQRVVKINELFDEAVRMSGLFINSGPIAQLKDPGGSVHLVKGQPGKALYNGPMVVLDNKLTASASEIFSGAMQDYGRAVIVGLAFRPARREYNVKTRP